MAEGSVIFGILFNALQGKGHPMQRWGREKVVGIESNGIFPYWDVSEAARNAGFRNYRIEQVPVDSTIPQE